MDNGDVAERTDDQRQNQIAEKQNHVEIIAHLQPQRDQPGEKEPNKPHADVSDHNPARFTQVSVGERVNHGHVALHTCQHVEEHLHTGGDGEHVAPHLDHVLVVFVGASEAGEGGGHAEELHDHHVEGEDVQRIHGRRALLPPAQKPEAQDEGGEREQEEEVGDGEGGEDGGTGRGTEAGGGGSGGVLGGRGVGVHGAEEEERRRRRKKRGF